MNSNPTSGIESVSQRQLEAWMRAALDAGRDGVERGEHAFGAAICAPYEGVVSAACNTVASTRNPSAHAEVNAIVAACRRLDQPQLSDFWLIATAEPCPMCLSTAALAGITRIAFGASQSVVNEAGYGGLGVSGCELAQQFSREITMRGSVLSNDCTAFLLNHRKPTRVSRDA